MKIIDPITDLWEHALKEALIDLATRTDKPGSRFNRSRETHWFLSSRYYIGSFKWICEQLGLSRKLWYRLAEQVASQEIMRATRRSKITLSKIIDNFFKKGGSDNVTK